MDNPVPEQPSYRNQVINDYDEELKQARLWARIIGILHTFSRFLAFCNLTWATVALLGAFLPDLRPLDFGFVTSLLFAEAGRLASASFFLRLLMRPLAYGSQNPPDIKHGPDEQYLVSLRLRLTSFVVQFLLIAPSAVLAIIGHIRLRSYSLFLNLNSSLRIFYSFVAFNSLVAFANVICSIQAFRVLYKPHELRPGEEPNGQKSYEQSILRYFDEVLERAISSGDLLRADVFEFFRFAYTMLGAEFQRYTKPELVAKNHKKLIEYLYAHRQGLDAMKTYLEAEDPFAQLAAANMVGFWCSRSWPGVGIPEEHLRLPEELLTTLADKVGTAQLGWAASNSFGELASTPQGALLVAEIRTSSNIRLPDRLVNLVDESGRSLTLVRTLVRVYEQYVREGKRSPAGSMFTHEKKLKEKLKKLAKKSRVHRLRVTAAYLLLLMDKRSVFIQDSNLVPAIDPSVDDYWYESEKQMLELLRAHFMPHAGEASFPTHAKRRQTAEPFVKTDGGIQRPQWLPFSVDAPTTGP